MDMWGFILIAVLLLKNRVSTDSVTVSGVVGRNVTLPCSTNQVPQNVYWRYNDSTTVLDVIKRKVDFDEQHSSFQGRVESFPSEFAKGNFSIRLRKLKKSDAGVYTCNIPDILIPGTVHLRVTENRSLNMRRPDSLLLFLLGVLLLSN